MTAAGYNACDLTGFWFECLHAQLYELFSIFKALLYKFVSMVINLGMWVRTFLSTSWVAPYRCFQIEGLVVLRCHFKFNDFWTSLLGDIVAHLSWCRQEQWSLEVDRYLEGITRGELTVFICKVQRKRALSGKLQSRTSTCTRSN